MDDQLGHFYNQLQSCTGVGQLEKLISAINTELESTQAQTEKYINESAVELKEDVKSIELRRLNLSSTLHDNSTLLVKKIGDANELSYKITRKIRLLDQENAQIDQAFRYIQNVIFLKNEIINCHAFLEKKNWKAASMCINRILTDLPPELLENDDFVSFVVPTSDLPELPKLTITSWRNDLTVFFKKEFEEAALNKDVAKLTEYFLLFPLLLKADVGLSCYSRFVVNLVNEQARNLLTSINKDSRSKPGFYSLTLLKIFEIISSIINQHSSLIVENYGSKCMLEIISKIQRECDTQSGLIFDTFWDAKALQSTLNRVSRYDFPILARMMLDGDEEETIQQRDDVSIIEINDLCYELATILKNWKMYCNFLKIKWDSYSGLVNNNEIPEPIARSSFVSKTREKIAPTFDELSTFQLRKSIEKSFQMEQLPDLSQYLISNEVSSPAMSSIIDDVILVLNNVLSRTLESGDEIIIKNMVTNSRRIIEIDLIQLLMKRLSMNYPRSNSSLVIPTLPLVKQSNEFSRDASMSPRAGTPINNNYGSLFMKGATSAISSAINFSNDDLRRLEHFIIYLNSIETLKNYVLKLIENLRNKLASDKLFVHYDENNQNIYNNSVTRDLSTILNGLGASIQKKCTAILDDNVNLLYQQCFNAKITKLVNDFFSHPDEYITSSSRGNEDVMRFITQFKSYYSPYQNALSLPLYLQLMSVITSKVSLLFERKMMGLKFTDVGSMALERNLSFIIGDISKIDYKLREKFLRVTQMILVLGLDHDDEDQLFNDDDSEEGFSIHWVLTPAERKKVRSLRIDLEKLN